MRETSHSLTTTSTHAAVRAVMGELATPAGQANPYPSYARLHGLGEVLGGLDEALIVTGYRACSALLREPRLRRSPERPLPVSAFPDSQQRSARPTMVSSLLMLNSPQHARLRDLVSGVLTAARVTELRPAVEALADRLCDQLDGPTDFIEAIAFPFSTAVIGELLGVPVEDRARFRALVADWSLVLQTTTGLLANGLVALLAHPAQAERLRREPELATPAVEELLRYDAPVQIIYGRSAADNVIVGDITLRAGRPVIIMLGAANRDPRVFTSPDELILDRDQGAVLAFGAGVNQCLGAALARLEAQVLLPTLLRRFPNLKLAGAPEYDPSDDIHSYTTLPVSPHE